MSKIRCTSNAEGLYIWVGGDDVASISINRDYLTVNDKKVEPWNQVPLVSIPDKDFETAIRMFDYHYDVPIQYNGVKVEPVYVYTDTLEPVIIPPLDEVKILSDELLEQMEYHLDRLRDLTGLEPDLFPTWEPAIPDDISHQMAMAVMWDENFETARRQAYNETQKAKELGSLPTCPDDRTKDSFIKISYKEYAIFLYKVTLDYITHGKVKPKYENFVDQETAEEFKKLDAENEEEKKQEKVLFKWEHEGEHYQIIETKWGDARFRTSTEDYAWNSSIPDDALIELILNAQFPINSSEG